ncbi:MAG: hypothetical protein IPF54_22140 [Draconibacterium sp.]|nr:hypothetical protein [Draconibacterium sp.]
MSGAIEIEIIIVEPIQLELDIAPSIFIGTAQAGPQGLPGEIGNIANMPDATETIRGFVRLASQLEVTTGTDTTKAIVPGTLKPELDKKAADEIHTLKLIFENMLV